MIAVILILAVAVGGIVWLRAAWVRLDRIEEDNRGHRDRQDKKLRQTRDELRLELATVHKLLATIRRTTLGDYADLLQQITDLREIEKALTDYLDDVPQNFAFHKAGVNYQLRLPERLRMVLSREG